jgi:type II secretory pathway component PulF
MYSTGQVITMGVMDTIKKYSTQIVVAIVVIIIVAAYYYRDKISAWFKERTGY